MGKKRRDKRIRNKQRQENTALSNRSNGSDGSNGSSELSVSSELNRVGALVVSGKGGSAISLEDVQKVLEGLGFEASDDVPSETSLPGVVPNGEGVSMNVVVGGKDDCKVISALVEDAPDKLDSYYKEHPDKYIFKKGGDEINLLQMAAYFGATGTAKWLVKTKKFDVDSVTDSGKNAVWYALRFHGEPWPNFKDEDITNNKWIDNKSEMLSFLLKSKDEGGAGASLNFAPIFNEDVSFENGNRYVIGDAWDAFFDLYNHLKNIDLEVKAYRIVNSMLEWDKNNIDISSLCLLGNVDSSGNAIPHYERLLNMEGDFFEILSTRGWDIIYKKIINDKDNSNQYEKDIYILEQKLETVWAKNKKLASELAHNELLQSEKKSEVTNKKPHKQELDSIKYELKTALSKIDELNALNKELKKQLDLKDDDVKKLSGEIEILNAKKDHYQSELVKEQERNKFLLEKLDEKTNMVLENDSLNIKNKDYQDQIESLVDKLSSSERSLSSSKMALDSEKEKITALEIEKAELYKQVESLQAINSSKSQEMLGSQSYIEHLNNELYVMQQNHSMVNQENSRLIQELSSSNSSLAQLEDMYGSIISSLRHELATLKSSAFIGANKGVRDIVQTSVLQDQDQTQYLNTEVESGSRACLVMSENFAHGSFDNNLDNNTNIEVGSGV